MKKIIFLLFVFFNIFLIYKITVDKDIYYVALGDYLAVGVTSNKIEKGYPGYIKDFIEVKEKLETYVSGYATSNYRTTDLIRDIEDNKKISIGKVEKTIQNVLIKADIVTLSIGMNDFIYAVQTDSGDLIDSIDGMMNDVERLFMLLRSFSKEKIVMTSLYYPYSVKLKKIEDLTVYANKRIKTLCTKYNIDYVDISHLKEGKINFSDRDIYPTKNGYEAIANEILSNSLNNM